MSKILKLFIVCTITGTLLIIQYNIFYKISSTKTKNKHEKENETEFTIRLKVKKDDLSEDPKFKLFKKILYWNPLYRDLNIHLPEGNKLFKNCKHNNCYATSNKSYIDVDKFDAIIFHSPDYKESFYGKPERRDLRQVYIFYTLEPPNRTPFLLQNYKNFYNWTMTYRLDSDVILNFGTIRKNKTYYKAPSVEEINKKTKKIGWFSSDCRTYSNRERLVDKIKNFHPVDVFGRCGEFECRHNCHEINEGNYKFFLALENSICEDYLTESVYKILRKNVIPIVYSGANYIKFLPKKSFINALDFHNVKDLVQFVKNLDRNVQEYLKYFEWKEDYVVEVAHLEEGFCNLCKKLNEPEDPKVYGDIFEWWFGENFNKCFDDVAKKKF